MTEREAIFMAVGKLYLESSWAMTQVEERLRAMEEKMKTLERERNEAIGLLVEAGRAEGTVAQ